MANICMAITVEGIMQQRVGSGPIQAGINLYNGLASTSAIALLTDQEEKALDHWLKVENLNKHNLIIESPVSYAPLGPSRRVTQVTELRNRGFIVDIVFDPDPIVCAELIKSGFNTCCFTHATYADPTWRPDFEFVPRSWDDLVEAVTLQKIARHEDARLKEKDKEVGDD